MNEPLIMFSKKADFRQQHYSERKKEGLKALLDEFISEVKHSREGKPIQQHATLDEALKAHALLEECYKIAIEHSVC